MFDLFGTKKKKELIRQQKATEAENYIAEVKSKKALPTIQTSIFLDKDEKAFLEEETKLNETRAIRKHSGGMGGIGFRVVKGVYVGGGRRSGTSESHQEWRMIDSGNLIITNQRMIFRGGKENRAVPLKKILSVSISIDAIEVAVESKSKSMVFPVQNGYIWGAVINILRQVDDPLNLGDLNLDIQFK
jgi:hypothetical protein